MKIYKYLIITGLAIYSVIIVSSLVTEYEKPKYIELAATNGQDVHNNNNTLIDLGSKLLRVSNDNVLDYLLITDAYDNPISLILKVCSFCSLIYLLLKLSPGNIISAEIYKPLSAAGSFYAISLLAYNMGLLYTKNWYVSHSKGLSSSYLYKANETDNLNYLFMIIIIGFVLKVYKTALPNYKYPVNKS